MEATPTKDLKWIFTDDKRCHLCGCPILVGEKVQMGKTMQLYPRGEAKLVQQQWHLDCATEMYEQ